VLFVMFGGAWSARHAVGTLTVQEEP